ncbi:MAG: nitroreductase family protein [Dehalococcoidales bacterium]|nr:nitroreductase family protein [Dehalococcoidales bacterium]
MEVFEAIKNRRSIRHYTSDPVDEATVQKLIEAANWAPSWGNTQCWRFIIIRDEETRVRIAETLKRVEVDGEWVENAAMKAIKQAPVLIVLCAELGKAGYRHNGTALTNKAQSWYIFDVALAMENLTLAATAMEMGTVIVGGFDSDKVDEILGVPDNLTVVTMTPLGVPAQPGRVSPRKKASDLVYYEKFGK